MATAATMINAVASSSGRVQLGSELRSAAAPICGRQVHFFAGRPATGLRQLARPQVVAALGSKKALNKYKSRQELEEDYYKEWEATTVLADEEAQRKMTALTLLTFIPNFIRFYVVPGPVRFLWYFVWSALQQAGYELRKKLVIAGVKLDLATMQRRGSMAGYEVRATALRRLHGKESLLAPIALALGR